MSVNPSSGRSVIVNVTDVPSRPHGYLEYPQDNPKSKSEFVYVNSAYVGSVNSVHSSRLYEPPTTVIREQYWACSKWSFAQRALALAVGVLLGTVISLVILIFLKDDDEDNFTSIFRPPSAPD